MLIHRFCSVCGCPLEDRQPEGDNKVRLCCSSSSCQHIHYLNPKPTVKGVVFKGHEVLLVRRNEDPGKGGWDFPGGYLEFDEHPEECLVREIEEETGVKVSIHSLVGVFQKVWKIDNLDSSILNLTYRCEFISGDPKVLVPKEIDRAQWGELIKPPGRMAFGHYQEVVKRLSSA